MESIDEIQSHMQSAYDRIAPVYSEHAVPGSIRLLEFATYMADRIPASGRVIDIGCGVGSDLQWFASRNIPAIGFDLSSGMLKMASHIVKSPLCAGNMLNMPFADGQFDGAWSCASLLHLPKAYAPRALQEIRRILCADGLLMLSIQAGDFEGWNSGYVEGVTRFFARYSEDEMTALLTQNGFTIEKVSLQETDKRSWLGFMCHA